MPGVSEEPVRHGHLALAVAMVGLCGAQARAALRGRDYTLPDDVQALAPLALPHRCIVRSDAALRGRTTEQIISELLEETTLNLGEETGDWSENTTAVVQE